MTTLKNISRLKNTHGSQFLNLTDIPFFYAKYRMMKRLERPNFSSMDDEREENIRKMLMHFNDHPPANYKAAQSEYLVLLGEKGWIWDTKNNAITSTGTSTFETYLKKEKSPALKYCFLGCCQSDPVAQKLSEWRRDVMFISTKHPIRLGKPILKSEVVHGVVNDHGTPFCLDDFSIYKNAVPIEDFFTLQQLANTPYLMKKMQDSEL
ncbi:hypothetical protein HA052_17850 [Chromobacterium haemolyticum]|uniref:Uncharacterized protein n=1 Tax=Chromobacterium fluminis TaxID=3044269 RepID=A0ABX0L5I5_9NEIS|nr:hypothetical protein [Chromobacterium haemolyticum]NHR07057.1 hypothetical protein [Chromobacterium haemolyticum]